MWNLANSTIAFFLSSLGLLSNPDTSLVAQTPFGQIEGLTSTSRDGQTYYEFLGLPYAQPPVGPLRFKDPVPWNESWEGIRDGTSETQRCVQYHLIAKSFNGDEDCLFLYVSTRKFQRVGEDRIPQENLKPVIFYIHGGMFMQGSGSFWKPKYFMDGDDDIVFVNMQYRVGALGFLNLETDDISGNMGLKDQVQALRWVRDNIHAFGGDASRVTLMGESAGSVSVHLHMLSPMSQGLFHGAISQSGTALNSWSVRFNPMTQAKVFAEKFGCPTNTSEEIADCLRGLDAKKIGRAHMDAATMLHPEHSLFSPTVESRENAATSKFLPHMPHDIIKSGNFQKVPWICGVNSAEGLMYAAPIVRNRTSRKEINSNWSHWIPIMFRFNDEPNKKEIANKMKQFYFGDISSEINEGRLEDLMHLATDRFFVEGVHNALALHKGHHPIYPYYYSYQGQFSFGRILLGMSYNIPIVLDFLFSTSRRWVKTKIFRSKEVFYGAAHGDELALLFNLPNQDVTEKHPDYDLSKKMVTAWKMFAINGTVPMMGDEVWQDISKDNDIEGHNRVTSKPIKWLKIDAKIETIDDPFYEKAKFWKSLGLFPEREYYETT